MFITWGKKLCLKNENSNLPVALCFTYIKKQSDLFKDLWYLHPKELLYFNNLKNDRRKKSYLLGRFSAKCAISIIENEPNLNKIYISQGAFSQPVVFYKKNIQVSITHSEGFGAAVAFPETHPIGIDFEKVNTDKISVLETQITKDEAILLKTIPLKYEEALLVFWTAKESISKILKTGLLTPFSIFELNKLFIKPNHIISCYKNFCQYCTVSFIINNFVCSITYPQNFTLEIDFQSLNYVFKEI